MITGKDLRERINEKLIYTDADTIASDATRMNAILDVIAEAINEATAPKAEPAPDPLPVPAPYGGPAFFTAHQPTLDEIWAATTFAIAKLQQNGEKLTYTLGSFNAMRPIIANELGVHVRDVDVRPGDAGMKAARQFYVRVCESTILYGSRP